MITLPISLLAIAALADVYTSFQIFKKGGRELNGFVAKLFGKRPSYFQMLLLKGLVFAATVYYGNTNMILFGAALWGLCALLNLKWLKEHKDNGG